MPKRDSSQAHDAQAPVLSKRFRLGERIASGGMASVYAGETVAEDDALAGRPLAIKVLHDHLAEDTAFVRMFRDEGRIAARFEHAHIVRVFAVGEDQGRHYIVMERVFGYNLAELLQAYRKRRRVVPKAAAFEILRQLLGALTYVHGFKGRGGRRLGIVHRDISPHNVLVDVQERVRLTDFGIARGQHRSDVTRTGTVKGKLHYMSPEQARGKRVDLRADLYALGAVAWELFTERPLLQADRTEALQARVMSGAIDLQSRKFDALGTDLQEWLRKALAPDKDDRFQSAEAMLAALSNVKGAGAARLKPGTLSRLLELLDTPESPESTQEPLLDPAEGRSKPKVGVSSADAPSIIIRTPQRPISGVFLGPDAVSRSRSTPSQRLQQLDPATLEAGARRSSRRGRRAARAVDVGAAAVRMSEVIALQAAGLDDIDAAPTAAASAKPAAQDANKRVSRVLVQRQRGVALASMVAWSCGALLLFGTLLEVWNARVELPRVTETTFASLANFSAWDAPTEDPEDDVVVVRGAGAGPGLGERAAIVEAAKGAALGRGEGATGSADQGAAPAQPTIRNDRFLPRDAPMPTAAKAGRKPGDVAKRRKEPKRGQRAVAKAPSHRSGAKQAAAKPAVARKAGRKRAAARKAAAPKAGVKQGRAQNARRRKARAKRAP